MYSAICKWTGAKRPGDRAVKSMVASTRFSACLSPSTSSRERSRQLPPRGSEPSAVRACAFVSTKNTDSWPAASSKRLVSKSLASGRRPASMCSGFCSCTRRRQASSNTSVRLAGQWPRATTRVSSDRDWGLPSSPPRPRSTAWRTKSAVLMPWVASNPSRMSRTSSLPRGSSRRIGSRPVSRLRRPPLGRECLPLKREWSAVASVSPQSAGRHETLNLGHPSFLNRATSWSSGERGSPPPARTSSRPSMKSTASLASGSPSMSPPRSPRTSSRAVTYLASSASASCLKAVVLPAPGSPKST